MGVALFQITWALNTSVRIFIPTRSSVWKCVNFPLLSWLSPCPAKEDERWTNEEYWRRLLWLPWWRRWCPCSFGTTGWEGRWGNLCELQKLTYFNWVISTSLKYFVSNLIALAKALEDYQKRKEAGDIPEIEEEDIYAAAVEEGVRR